MRDLLNPKTIEKAKARTVPYRLPDGDNLYLLIAPSGTKSWQVRDKGTTATLGKFPKVSLASARRERDKALALMRDGVNYSDHKRQVHLERRGTREDAFGEVARKWLAKTARHAGWSDVYVEQVEGILSNHLSCLDKRPVSEITLKEHIAPALERVENASPAMWDKVKRTLDAILDHCVLKGDITGNPLPKLKRKRKLAVRHYPAVTDLRGIGDILRNARKAESCKGVMRAHMLLAFTSQRVGEVVGATWSEFALDGVDVPVEGIADKYRHDPNAGNWVIPRGRMKRKDKDLKQGDRIDHTVPIPPALLSLLREWRKADGADGVYVCPAPRDDSKPITAEAAEKFYQRALDLKGKHSPHSWRSAFSTIAREKGKNADVVESQLDHLVGSKVAQAYDRAKRVELRRELMGWYEQTLVVARDGAQVVALRA